MQFLLNLTTITHDCYNASNIFSYTNLKYEETIVNQTFWSINVENLFKRDRDKRLYISGILWQELNQSTANTIERNPLYYEMENLLSTKSTIYIKENKLTIKNSLSLYCSFNLFMYWWYLGGKGLLEAQG